MNKDEMFRKLGIEEPEYKELLAKFAAFFNSLDDNQKKIINAWMPKYDQIAKAFGPDVSVDELRKLGNLENVCVGVAAVAFVPPPPGPGPAQD